MNSQYHVSVSVMLETVRGRRFDIDREFDTPEAAIEASKYVINELIKSACASVTNISAQELASNFIDFDYLPAIFGPKGWRSNFDARRYAVARCYEVCGETMPSDLFSGGIWARSKCRTGEDGK